MELRDMASMIIENSRELAVKHGEECLYFGASGNPKRMVYEDSGVRVTASPDDNRVEIYRKENHNPVVMVNAEGKIYRWHGEVYKIKDHLLGLFQDMK